jgi:TM2 domain-containing membrane protein YozV
MKRLFTVILLTGMFSLATFAGKSDYKLNNAKMNALFENAVEMNITDLAKSNLFQNAMHKFGMVGEDVQTTIIIAFVVDWVGLGGLGIHRYILGTKPAMFALYLFTCGGIFGIVPLIDGIVLLVDGLINENGEKYIDNEKFLMWTN